MVSDTQYHGILAVSRFDSLQIEPAVAMHRNMQPSRGRSDATLLPLALALAGQVRTLQEERMRTELFRTVVRPSGAAVFAHLSPEDYAAAWHFGRKNSSSIVAPPTMVPLFDGFEAAFRRQFQPEFFALVADAELERHRRWTGALPGAVRPQSALYLRWLVLYDAVERHERETARRFAYVLRLRPDMLPGCVLTPQSVAQLLEPGLDAVSVGDQLVLLRRSAVRVALRVYLAAPTSAHCRLAPELCVDAILLLANRSLARARPGTAVIVRSEPMCQTLQHRSELGWSAHGQWTGHGQNLTDSRLWRHSKLCGRAALDADAPRAVAECSREVFSPARASIGVETARFCVVKKMACTSLCHAWRRLEKCRCPDLAAARGEKPWSPGTSAMVPVASVNASALERFC